MAVLTRCSLCDNFGESPTPRRLNMTMIMRKNLTLAILAAFTLTLAAPATAQFDIPDRPGSQPAQPKPPPKAKPKAKAKAKKQAKKQAKKEDPKPAGLSMTPEQFKKAITDAVQAESKRLREVIKPEVEKEVKTEVWTYAGGVIVLCLVIFLVGFFYLFKRMNKVELFGRQNRWLIKWVAEYTADKFSDEHVTVTVTLPTPPSSFDGPPALPAADPPAAT